MPRPQILASLCTLAAYLAPATASCAYGTAIHPRQAERVEVNTFGYSGNIGPTNWISLDPANNQLCAAGTRQSPINMVSGQFQVLPGNSINLQIPDMPQGTKFENLGTTVEVIAQGGSMNVPGVGDFNLQQFHFHLPSEHLDNGKSIAMEMHMVFESAATPGQIAVIGTFIEVAGSEAAAVAPPPPAEAGAGVPAAEPAARRRSRIEGRASTAGQDHVEKRQAAGSTVLLETVFSSIGAIATPGTVTTTQPLVMSEVVNALVAGEFQTYSGSLTTPPCSEGVTWLVASSRLSVQTATFASVRNTIGFNSRFPQNTLGEPNVLQLGMSAAVIASGQQPLVSAPQTVAAPPANINDLLQVGAPGHAGALSPATPLVIPGGH